jgi:ABC-2 type transport system ATP-binding protein
MRVREYLKFRARLKGLSRRRSRERVDVVMEQCDLTHVSRRINWAAFEGVPPRVGLADALVHEPELIILDEPTIGLDPPDSRRPPIDQEPGRDHTVLISTHILPEAEMTCNRMVIMYEGSILAADSPDNLQRFMSGHSQILAEIAAPLEELNECWAQMPEVEQFDVSPAEGAYHRCALTPRDGLDLRPRIYELARPRGWLLRELPRNRHSLEDIYVQVTRPEEEEES